MLFSLTHYLLYPYNVCLWAIGQTALFRLSLVIWEHYRAGGDLESCTLHSLLTHFDIVSDCNIYGQTVTAALKVGVLSTY